MFGLVRHGKALFVRAGAPALIGAIMLAQPVGAQSIDVNQAVNSAIQTEKSLDGLTDVKVDLYGTYHGTYDCGGHNARIGGGQSVLTLKNCNKVAIDGGHNSVTIYGASSIRLLGSYNTVKWSGDDKPVIDNRGSENNIVKL